MGEGSVAGGDAVARHPPLVHLFVRHAAELFAGFFGDLGEDLAGEDAVVLLQGQLVAPGRELVALQPDLPAVLVGEEGGAG